MDYSKHPDVINNRASQAEMAKWYSYMDEDFEPVYPDRQASERQTLDHLSVTAHVGQASLVMSQVAREVLVR